MQENLIKYFWYEGHKGFLNEASVIFTDKTDRKTLNPNLGECVCLFVSVCLCVCEGETGGGAIPQVGFPLISQKW